MIHQLRIYEIFERNKAAFHARFRDHAARIMARHGFRIIALWETASAGRIEFDRSFALRALLGEVRFGYLPLGRAMAAMAARIIRSGDGHGSFPGERVAQDAGSPQPWQARQGDCIKSNPPPQSR